MATCSIAQFAKSHGASKQAASKWKSRGVLVFSGDQVNVEASNKRMRDAGLGNYRQASTPALAVDDRDNLVVGRRQPVVTDDDDSEFDPVSLDDFLGELNRGTFRSQVDAQKIKENALAARQLLSLRKDAGELIEIEQASIQFFELARQQRDAWLTWPTRIGPMLAADLGVDTARTIEALTNYVQEQLEAIGEPEPDFETQ